MADYGGTPSVVGTGRLVVGGSATSAGDIVDITLPSSLPSKYISIRTAGDASALRIAPKVSATTTFYLMTNWRNDTATVISQDDATKYGVRWQQQISTTSANTSITFIPAGATATSSIIHTSTFSSSGKRTFTQSAVTGATPNLFECVGGAHLACVAGTEANDIYFNLARTVEFATGALATQRAVRIGAPTYAFVGASTLTDAATVYIANAPQAGANATLTRSYPLWIDAGTMRYDDTIAMGAGGAPTLGTTGGSGPAGTAQVGWLRMYVGEDVSFVPYWQ